MPSNLLHLEISKIELWPVDVAMTDPFITSQGGITTARNLIVKVELTGGGVGFGEVAPFFEQTGEDRDTCSGVAEKMAQSLLGRPVSTYRRLAEDLRAQWPANPATRCGMETAIVDSFSRAVGMPLWALWGGADVRKRATDITIPIGEPKDSVAIARHWHDRGFTLFKLKVGTDVELDLRRLAAIDSALDGATFVLDANQGFTEREAVTFARAVKHRRHHVLFFEQPVSKDDIEGMAAVRNSIDIPVAADESVVTVADCMAIIRANAADIINLKIMKSGLVESMNIAALARANGLRLMIGGMVETRIAMGCSFSLVLGVGEIEHLDLDTPLLMSEDPISGGYSYDGPLLCPWDGPGLAMQPACASTTPAKRFLNRGSQ